MISGINEDADIEIFLEAEELKELPNKTIEGVLVKWRKPKRQGTISISINDAKRNEKGFGIGIDDKQYWGVQDNFKLFVFMGNESYADVVEKGGTERRQKLMEGSKINVYDVSRLCFEDAQRAKSLEMYRDDKDKLPDAMG